MLSSYINVYNTCLVLLSSKGYVLSYDKDGDVWLAKKDDFDFVADNPIELLGLIAIREEINPQADTEYWWRLDEPDLYQELTLPRPKE